MILFIDDEAWRMDSYVQELKMSGLDVSFLQSVDEAISFVNKNTDRIELIILDIMMHSGETFKDMDTREGLRTGVHVYSAIRQVSGDLPVMILTNVSDEEVYERFRTEENCRFLRKENYLPFELVEQVMEMISIQK